MAGRREGTSQRARQVRLTDLPLNQPLPWTTSSQGRQYEGEVVRADRWQPGWGQPLPPGIDFRLVLLAAPQEMLPGDLQDRRILVLAPGHPLPPAPTPRRLREVAPAYQAGRIYGLGPVPLQPGEVFATPDIRPGLDRLARSLLDQALAAWQRLGPLAEAAPQIEAARAYLQGASLGLGEAELAMDRASLLEQINLDNLAANPHLWPSLQALFGWFRSRYSSLYQGHHTRYHQELAQGQARLREARLKLEALRRLNSIPELGLPLGPPQERYQALVEGTRPCPNMGAALSLEAQPRCPLCRLSLGAAPPAGEVSRFLEELEEALGQQHRRLGSQAIKHILARSQDSRIDRFLKVLQASDPSPLAQVLDDELTDFLRQLLIQAQALAFPILARFKERFPVLEEGQAEEAVAYFRSQLQDGFREARRRAGGQPRIAPE